MPDKKMFFAYFDLLGYKDVNLGSNPSKQPSMQELARFTDLMQGAIEHSLTDELKFAKDGRSVIIDVDAVKIQTIVFSDTIIFFTRGDTVKDYLEVLKVAYTFNWRSLQVGFPSRGIVYYGDFNLISGPVPKANGQNIIQYTLGYGPAGMEAHLKCDLQEWAGACIDKSAYEILAADPDGKKVLDNVSVDYEIPFKNGDYKFFSSFINKYIYARPHKLIKRFGVFSNRALRLYQNVGETKFIFESVESHFKAFGKQIKGSVVDKFENTKRFITHLSELTKAMEEK
ncbi:MAG: hypothetical protein BGO69_15930 [Bacteroidetes bacterium 46-16]|nr:MAG: hypothetical protein BGO69_15930 [Bacteroidetes bacterium 46-16]